MAKYFNYYYLPKKYHKSHDYCQFILTQIEELIVDKKFNKLREQKLKMNPQHLALLKTYEGTIMDFLEENGLIDELNHITQCNMLNALIMESCYFLQEAFSCSLKMRFTVSFTLFRKPFFEILIIYMRLLFEDDFISKFNNENNFNPLTLSKTDKENYLRRLNEALLNLYNTDELFDYLFNKSDGNNLYNIGNNAIHLHTSRNPVINTEKQNLNFIFSTIEDKEAQWEYIYDVLPMLLNFFADVTDLCVVSTISVPEKLIFNRFTERHKMKSMCQI
jgi:hypothetical protein